MELLTNTLEKIQDLDRDAMDQARKRMDNLIKPMRSLGRLEDLAIQISGITGKLHAELDDKAIIVMAASNGICEEGVAAAPSDVTLLMTNFIGSGVSGVRAISKTAGIDVITVDIGVDGDVSEKSVLCKKVKSGTDNMAKGPAMSREEAVRAIEIGIEIATEEIQKGRKILGTGEMGIGNTSTSTAILSVLSGKAVEEIVGVGANLPEAQVSKKAAAIRRAIEVNNPNPEDIIDVLAKVGGLDIAGMAGVMIAGAANRVPVVVDGYISTIAALVAERLDERVKHYLIASHASCEKGAKTASDLLGLDPMLNMEMRLGEGSGAALAFPIIEAASQLSRQMLTFEETGIMAV
ncbi:nicotinate-nucleotide--dimethylbenzimidazole phosphoribosyltransferase [Clostridia bacterium]|nr:nicotinate-nucleotide--dimethylbenzimidazole phosphoribosyltransferase [Clostridia bacterium]